jgi:hypothetical protein
MVVATSALWAGPLQAAPLGVPGNRLRFVVMRNGSEIGRHELTFRAAGDDLVVHIDCSMRVGFGPFTFFRYHHQGEERWSGGRFVSLKTRSDNNGEALQVSARRVAEGVRVEATNLAPAILSADAVPLTHWNVAAMSGQLFNPQDGKPLHVVTRRQGMDVVALGDGTRVKAVRYSMDGKLPISDWYDQGMVWTALQAKVKDGSTLRYVREG